nr:PREDICTED: cleavage and polyadenylation specificity factor subunit 1 [Apteryx mantelli mantelli]
MYAVYKQAHPPTGLEFSMYCNFFSNAERNLVVAGTSQLYVYRLNHDSEVRCPPPNPLACAGCAKAVALLMRFVDAWVVLEPIYVRRSEQGGVVIFAVNSLLYLNQSVPPYGVSLNSLTNGTTVFPLRHKEKLELVASFAFFGNVMSMASVQLAGAKRDALLLSFKDAKLSVVEYDPGTHDLKTLSLHYFEEPELRDGFVQNVHIPKVRVDPDGRCAVMLIYGTRLVVLPFRRDTLTDEHEGVMGEGQKSSFLPSYIIDVRELDEKLLNIIDMQFLYGYYEPTLLILFEPNQTWPGRVAVRQDTCSIVAISLNIMQKVHPVIWSLSNLPFDCTQALAVPKPIGGDGGDALDPVPLAQPRACPGRAQLATLSAGVQDGVKVTLDCAQATFISYDKMVISLKGGEIYVLTLITDGMRSVRSFHFDKAAASVLTTEEPPMKKKRSESSGNWAGGKSAPQDEVDEIEVYGSEAQSGTQLATYSFEVRLCAAQRSVGGTWVSLRAETGCDSRCLSSSQFQNSPEPDLEIVLCSGYGKNGALSVLQKSIRPQVVTTFELPGCYDMWTVISPQKKEEPEENASGENAEKEQAPPEPEDDSKRHGFLILSREDSTMILQTGQEIMELDTSGFATQGPTVFAGNIGENRYIVQVSPLGIRLLEGVNQLHFIPVDLGSPIVHCAVADPYVVIMSAEGQVTMFVLKSDTYGGRTHRLTLQKPQLHHRGQACPRCNPVPCPRRNPVPCRGAGQEPSAPSRALVTPWLPFSPGRRSDTVDDEEEMLYGDSGALFSPAKEEPRRSSLPSADRDPHQYKVEPTHWCVLVRENGAMEIYQLPDWRLVFLVKNFPMGQRVLVDSSFGQPAAQGDAKKEEVTRQGELPLVKEAVATSVINSCTRIPRMTGEEKEFESIERDERYIHPQQEAFSIQLISPVSWETIPNTRIDLEEWEHVTCMKTVSLKSEETVSGLKGYIAIGTCLMQGEEVTCRGRILIMDIIEVVPEPGQPLTKNKFKVLYEKEQKGPVTALCHCNGYLVSAIGQKIFLWSLKDNDLTGMAFIDTQLYIHQMISVKNFILAADVMKSISLLRYQEESKTLSLVSRDAKPLEVYSVDFMVDCNQLGFLVSDRDRNLLVYMYLPEAKESFGGMRLLRRADFHVGAHVNTFWRTPCRGATDGPTKKSIVWENKHITWFGEGGLLRILEDLLEIDRVTAHF